ncbi:hypothetical protein A4X13_0g5130 [Tilletia indica]|uniref:Acyl-CoA oxidase C-alpha1 domain-containing protein n=1 Tax=Tilletia indica TaxID=43049 RepID=A0A177TFS4_9BASI|nr:hypothetical protein A4X13_0g5130 [Tilletia indica]
MRHEFMGAYLQTEFGHGSIVAGVDTTATLDKSTDSFIIDPPTLTSTKWRTLPTFPGVNAGDIGPKAYGVFAALDNGWSRFDHYRIPRENMFITHSQVSNGGVYTNSLSAKMSYLDMMFILFQMIDRCGWMLSRGIAIAIRYSSVRRRFRDPESQTPPAKLTPNAQSSPTHPSTASSFPCSPYPTPKSSPVEGCSRFSISYVSARLAFVPGGWLELTAVVV